MAPALAYYFIAAKYASGSMAYQERIDALIEHHRKLAEKLGEGREKELAKEIEDKFETAQILIRDYEFRLVKKDR